MASWKRWISDWGLMYKNGINPTEREDGNSNLNGKEWEGKRWQSRYCDQSWGAMSGGKNEVEWGQLKEKLKSDADGDQQADFWRW